MTDSGGNFDTQGFNADVSGQTTLSSGSFLASTGSDAFIGGLTISGGTLSAASATSIMTGSVTLSSGSLLVPTPSGSFTVSGNWSETGGSFTAGTGTVTFTAAAGIQTFNSDGMSFNNISHSGPALSS